MWWQKKKNYAQLTQSLLASGIFDVEIFVACVITYPPS